MSCEDGYLIKTDGTTKYTKNGNIKYTVSKYNTTENSNLLKNVANNFGIGNYKWVQVRITAISYTTASSWFCYVIRFYNESSATNMRATYKIGGTKEISSIDNTGTIVTTMDNDNPHYVVELLNIL